MECRVGCGACCIAPSIRSSIPGMPNGKAAGVRCVQLDDNNECKIFGNPGRPEVCRALMPSEDMCGATTEEAMHLISVMEIQTQPGEKE